MKKAILVLMSCAAISACSHLGRTPEDMRRFYLIDWDILTVRMHTENGKARYSMAGQTLNEDQFERTITRLGSVFPSVLVVVSADRKTSTPDLMRTFLMIRQAHFTNIVVSAPASWKGQEGYITLPMNIAPVELPENEVGRTNVGGFDRFPTNMLLREYIIEDSDPVN